MKKIIWIIFTVAFLTLTGCATLPTPSQMAEETKNFTLPQQNEAGNALVYVVRPSPLGGAIRFNIFLDDKEDASEMGFTRGVQHIYFYVSLGKHSIYSNAENWAEIDINAKEGDIIFLKQNPEMGILFARNSIQIIDEIEGKYHMKNTEIGEIKKLRKERP